MASSWCPCHLFEFLVCFFLTHFTFIKRNWMRCIKNTLLYKEYMYTCILYVWQNTYNIHLICMKGYTNEHCNISFICNMSSGCPKKKLCWRRTHARLLSALLGYLNLILYDERVMQPAHLCNLEVLSTRILTHIYTWMHIYAPSCLWTFCGHPPEPESLKPSQSSSCILL